MRISDWSSDVCSSDLSLGGNVKGSFACRAPEGTCAPTSTIDAGATGIEKADTVDAHWTVTPTGEAVRRLQVRSEEHTSELQSLMRISYAVFCLKKKPQKTKHTQ